MFEHLYTAIIVTLRSIIPILKDIFALVSKFNIVERAFYCCIITGDVAKPHALDALSLYFKFYF